MSETPLPESPEDDRLHSEDPAEGADPDDADEQDETPREHSEDPSEG